MIFSKPTAEAVLDEFSVYKQNMEKYLSEIAGIYEHYITITESLLRSTRTSSASGTILLKARLTAGTRNY